MTPLHLNIALHYHCRTVQWPDLHNPLHREYAGHLVNAGLLSETKDAGGLGTGCFTRTDGLAVWVEALCATPLPELRWVMPTPDAIRAGAERRTDHG